MGSAMRILVAGEGIEELRAGLKLLSDMGYSVIEATGESDLLELIGLHRPHVAILCPSPGDMSAVEVCGRIKSSDELKDTIVLFCSNTRAAVDRQADYSRYGADGWISSPIGAGKLLARVELLLGARRAEALRASEERYRRFFEDAVLGIFQTTLDGKIIKVNPAYARMFGFDSPEEVKTAVNDIALDLYADSRRRREVMDMILKSPGPIHTENRFRRKDGSVFTANLHAWAVRDGDGKFIYFEGFAEDISERKRSEEALRASEAKYRNLIDTMNDGFLMVDEKAVFTLVNDKFCEMTGYSREELLGAPARLALDREIIGSAQMSNGEESRSAASPREMRLTGKGGAKGTVLVFPRPIFDESGEYRGGFGTVTDITKRKKLEEELKEQQRRLSTLIDNLPGIVYRCKLDRDRTMEFLSDGCLQVTGCAPSDLIGNRRLSYNDVIHPNDREMVWEQVRSAVEAGRPFKMTYRILTADAEERTVWEQGRGVFSPEGALIAVEGFITDITDLTRIEAALRQSEARYRAIVEDQAELITRSLPGGFITFCNRAYARFFEDSADDLIGGSFWHHIHPDDVERLQAYFAALGPDNPLGSIEHRCVMPSGEVRWLQWTDRAIMGDDGRVMEVQSVGRDVTERRQFDEALLKSERRYRELADFLPQGVFEMYPDGRVAFANRAIFKMFRFSPEDFDNGVNALSMIAPEDRKRVLDNIRKRMAGEEIDSSEYTALRTDGTRFPVLIYTTPILEGGERTALRGVLVDITEVKRAEAILREKEAQYRGIFNAATDAFIIFDSVGRIIDANPSACGLYGYSYEEMLGLSGWDIVHPDYHSVFEGFLTTVIKKGVFHGHSVEKRKDGSLFKIEVSGAEFEIKGETHLLAVIRDITERERMERQLRQAEKLEAVGSLAGGIAHDFNNILGIILGHCEVARFSLPEDSPAHGNLDQMTKACKRAKEAVSQILAFSRGTDEERKPLGLTPLMKETVKFLRASIPATIDIRFSSDIPAGQDTIAGDPSQIRQAIVNLCSNATDTMGQEGGVLELDLSVTRLDLPVEELSPGEYMRMTVKDMGRGAGGKASKKIIAPGLSTNDVGESAGLGLSVVQGIVKNHGGGMRALSDRGGGAAFEILLPRLRPEKEAEEGRPAGLPRGGESVLLVDDERMLVNAGKRMLEWLGYKVTAASSGPEALETFRAGPDRFDLVITDLTMPRMSGLDLAGQILLIRPDMPIILSTGFNRTITSENAEAHGIRGCVMKPVALKDLAVEIRRVLGESRPANPQGNTG